jgi:hypothetical protein
VKGNGAGDARTQKMPPIHGSLQLNRSISSNVG